MSDAFVCAYTRTPIGRNGGALSSVRAQYGVESMPETAENAAEDTGISRADQDDFAHRSQHKAAAAQASGRVAREITPILVPQRKGPDLKVEVDEHPRATTLEKLGTLPTPFRLGGSVTAGNASGVNDDAAALVIASGVAVATHGLTPIARIIRGATAAVAPRTNWRRCAAVRSDRHVHRSGPGDRNCIGKDLRWTHSPTPDCPHGSSLAPVRRSTQRQSWMRLA